uniref:Uncharacterized protein n=1 Tax=Setaria italica TaxID=4555 RepID=K3ZAB1_SETIT
MSRPPPSLVTTSAVLQYSRTSVTRPPGPTVHACTQYSAPVASVPSASTVGPNASSDRILNGRPPPPPVSRRMSTRCWCARGPWNHQSTSGFSRRRTASTSPRSSARYSFFTTALLLITASSPASPSGHKPASPAKMSRFASSLEWGKKRRVGDYVREVAWRWARC